MILSINPDTIQGLTKYEADAFKELLRVYEAHRGNNEVKDRYYEGKISLNSVNLGIALPKGMQGLEIGCAWGAKCVDVLAARSMFDGFVGMNGETVDEIDELVQNNRMIAEYMKACKDELEFGCTFGTLSPDPKIKCKIRFHSPRMAAACWDGKKGRIAYGMAIIDTAPDYSKESAWIPSVINMYLDYAVIVFQRNGYTWSFNRVPHKMGRPLMEPMIWNATSSKPFGRSRIKEPIRRLIQGYVRTLANASIGLEFATAPQKYLLGVTDDQYDALTGDKFQQYVGNILAATANPETGEKPTFGQLMQGNISPHTEMLRNLASQFAAQTGLPISETGVINDANPTSSDAILAQSQTLVAMAEQLNTGNGNALRTIALMALAIANDTTLEELSDEQKDVIAHFKNPAMPSVA
ncbi:MAG: hypothetical protein K6E83_06535, partial [Clostridium sp.]|nr:hypothetical protein [Clostridium sp.]